eukprot:CAMPEP_0116927634 /NCGR_PEP_ID=MMETSP0467-20121206/25484_1 /TAXON_ID=283647 /ORGANISM="Mesodinium pulex, Strain SPMC105" /LENGTH=71 /DNA_ID=CAMNT_0004607213 /DNA_START=384 /DNA_END=599 /DNA_ORIENTATION=-
MGRRAKTYTAQLIPADVHKQNSANKEGCTNLQHYKNNVNYVMPDYTHVNNYYNNTATKRPKTTSSIIGGSN